MHLPPALASCPGKVFAAPGLTPWPAVISLEVGSSFENQASQSEIISPRAGRRKRQLVGMCQLRKCTSVLFCGMENSDLAVKHDLRPGLLSPVFASGTTLWFSLLFNSNSSLPALPASVRQQRSSLHLPRFSLDIVHQLLTLGPLRATGHQFTAPTGVFQPDKGCLGGLRSEVDQIRGAGEPFWPQTRTASGQRGRTPAALLADLPSLSIAGVHVKKRWARGGEWLRGL